MRCWRWLFGNKIPISLSEIGAGAQAGPLGLRAPLPLPSPFPPLRHWHAAGLRLIDSCTTQRKAQGPSRTCNESKKEEEDLRFVRDGRARINAKKNRHATPYAHRIR